MSGRYGRYAPSAETELNRLAKEPVRVWRQEWIPAAPGAAMRVLRWVSTDQTLTFGSGPDDVPDQGAGAALGLDPTKPDLPDGTPLSTAGPGTPALPRPATAPHTTSTELNTSTTTPATAAVTPALDTDTLQENSPAPPSEALPAVPAEPMEVDPPPAETVGTAGTAEPSEPSGTVQVAGAETAAGAGSEQPPAQDTHMADVPADVPAAAPAGAGGEEPAPPALAEQASAEPAPTHAGAAPSPAQGAEGGGSGAQPDQALHVDPHQAAATNADSAQADEPQDHQQGAGPAAEEPAATEEPAAPADASPENAAAPAQEEESVAPTVSG